MQKDFPKTHLLILNTARTLFLNNSFESISLREICKTANITTGCFYRHFTNKDDLYNNVVGVVVSLISQVFQKSMCNENKSASSFWQSDNDQMEKIFSIAYAHPLEIRILLTNSKGTIYENFISSIAIQQVQYAKESFKLMKMKGVNLKEISDFELQILAQSQLSSFAKILISDLPINEALESARKIDSFYLAGWKALLM